MNDVRPIAVVTGASSGIGEAVAIRLAAAGWHVVCAARRLKRLQTLARRIDGTAVELDVTDDASVDRLREVVSAVAATGGPAAAGRVNLLVNNAGAALGTQPVDSLPVADLRAMLDLNVLGTLRVTQAMLPLLRQAPSASIVMMSSTAALGTYEGGGGYTAAKHGVGALTRTLRLELNGEPIRICELAPGMVQTEFSLKRFGGDAERAAAVYRDVDRPLTADDVARCVEWVATAPVHLNVDLMVIRPVAQAAQHKAFRGPLFSSPQAGPAGAGTAPTA